VNLSHGLLATRDAAGAIAAARAAIAAEPGLAAAHQALGNALLEEGDVAGARAAFESALRLVPDFADAAGNLATLEARYGDASRACVLFESLANRDGAHADWHAKALARAGRDDAAQAVRLAAVSRAANPAELARESPLLFAANYDSWSPERLWELHRQWGGALEAFVGAPAAAKRDRRGGPLRAGFVSNDFKRHSCAHFLLPVFEAFDPARIAVTAYSDVEKPDAITARLRASTAAWRDIRGRDDASVAAEIRADGIDILVDLGGHTVDHRLGVFARKPAPVQVSWLGYANTTGLSRVDWRFTDAIADPPGAEAYHSERLWRLAGGFLRFAAFETPPIPVRAPAPDGFRFGSFNALEKISGACWTAWCGILRAVPGSTLTLKAFALKDKATRAAWSARARDAELGERVRLLSFEDDDAAHLARYGEIDLALDTAPYGGTTTSCEALWMGVPLLTLAGPRHATRVGASLLARIPDAGIVADSWDSYRDAAVELAARGEIYRRCAERLAERARAGALSDGASLAAEMADAFEKMFERA
jgi:predicted O-linked N-acetylglucosamine transferase (SPINDLY family)